MRFLIFNSSSSITVFRHDVCAVYAVARRTRGKELYRMSGPDLASYLFSSKKELKSEKGQETIRHLTQIRLCD